MPNSSVIQRNSAIKGVHGVGKHQSMRPSQWCTSLGKRAFDVFLATLFLILAFPFMLLASALVLSSPGPLLFASNRLGQRGKPIRVLKFRTMYHRTELGIQLTRKGDERITKSGRFLRKWKIDELPQLINVLRGDMSLVGPRPDSAEFLDKLPADLQPILAIRPGITSVATLQFRHEEDLLSFIPERELATYYVKTLLPEKVQLDLKYACRANLFTDLMLLLRTGLSILR
jgi:lipopolysaccharide/colanic/teichoic acid biosynthesis glycosyltransferase